MNIHMLDAKGHGQRSCSKHEPRACFSKVNPKPNIQNVTQTMHFRVADLALNQSQTLETNT